VKKIVVYLTLILFGIPMLLILGVGIAFLIANRTNEVLVSSGERRTYLLYVPESYTPNTPTPLVISIHGFSDWPAHQMKMSHWNDLADEYGFIVAYPAGTSFPLRWRAHGGSDHLLDVTFFSDLIDDLESQYHIDPASIYVNGLSNGGGMTFVLSCAMSERIAAIGMVSGAYLFPWNECHPSRPVPAIVFHGTEDAIVPYQGGPSGPFDYDFPSISEWVDILALRNGCSRETIELPAQGNVNGLQYAHCSSNADVIFYTIVGGGHSWPGGEPMPERIVGTTTDDMDATRAMWEFFQQHPLVEE